MSMSQQGQNQRAVRELSAQEVYNYFYPRPTPKWNIGAIVFGVALIPVGIFLHSILLSVAGARGLDTLDIQLHNQDQVLTIRSYVLPGSLTAHDYLHEEVLMKHGKDGRQRFSINVYTFIFCTARFLAIFESDVNVFNPLIHRDIHEIYGYPTIFTATTIPLEDTVVFDEQEVPYRTELFCLKFVNGETGKFSAAVKARPWGSIPDAPAITLPSTNFDKKLSKLRQILLYHQK